MNVTEIQRIQWIMTKSKNSIVTSSTTYLNIVTFPVIVIESTFSLLHMGRYLLPLTTLNGYLSRHNSKIFIFNTSSENITITRYRVFLVTIPILYFVSIHWIQWIQGKSFRKNSNNASRTIIDIGKFEKSLAHNERFGLMRSLTVRFVCCVFQRKKVCRHKNTLDYVTQSFGLDSCFSLSFWPFCASPPL